jgi:hypothetical protein
MQSTKNGLFVTEHLNDLRHRRRSLEEEENNNDNGGGDDDGNAISYDEGYITAARCSSYKIEESEDSNVELVLKWNTAYGNGLDVFRVAQKSFVYYDYASSHSNENNDGDGDDDSFQSASRYLIDLDSWLQTGATLGLGKDAGPACQQMENPEEIFQTKNRPNDDITRYFSIRNNQYNNYFGDWEPKLYLGPICGMGDSSLNWGVFLDDTCTTYLPDWTYRYRNALAKGQVPYDTDAVTLLDLSYYTGPTPSAMFGTKMYRWRCPRHEGLCETLLSYSADTLYCEVPEVEMEEEEEQQQARNRKLEEGNDDNTDDGGGDDDDNYVADDYFENGYQLSQDDLEDIETECEALVTSHLSDEGTLQEYLKHFGQLKHTKDYKKQLQATIKFSVLAVVLFGIVVSATMFVKCRNEPKRVKFVKGGGGDSKSGKASSPGGRKKTRYTFADTTSSSGGGKKTKAGWLSGLRGKKTDDKKQILLQQTPDSPLTEMAK